jgi:response regulator of citrate/malate metabolism
MQKKLPVVIMCVEDQHKSHVEEAMDLGAIDYLVFPMTSGDVKKSLGKAGL